MAIIYYSIPQSDFKSAISLVATELNLRLEREDYENAKMLSGLLQEFLPPMGDKNHLVGEDSLKAADLILDNRVSLYAEVLMRMDSSKVVIDDERKWTEYRMERVGNKINWIEIEDQEVGA